MRGPKKRFFIIISILFTLGYFLPLVKLYDLQFVKHSEWVERGYKMRTRIIRYPPSRGDIISRDEKILASSAPSYDLEVIPAEIKNKKTINNNYLHETEKIFGTSISSSLSKALEISGPLAFQPFTIKMDLSFDELSKISSLIFEHSYLILDKVPKRYYPHGRLASHVIGYIGRDTFMYVGKSGIEYIHDDVLKGEPGGKIVETDAFGRIVKVVEQLDGEKGGNVILSLDSRLQEEAEDLFEDKEGALVAMNVNNGDIVALVSKPDFDPNDFSRALKPDIWKEYINNPSKPILSRYISAKYNPGSVFKVIVAIAALEEGVATQDTLMSCPGYFQYGNNIHRCWKEKGHGIINMKEAIVHSCDVYFYNLGLRLGPAKIAKWARNFGLGQKTGIDLPGEVEGIVPDPVWKIRTLGHKWYEGESISYAVGQGYILVTPLQIARAFAAIANGGFLVKPKVAFVVNDAPIQKEEEILQIPVSKKTIDFIKDALLESVERGTGYRAKIPNIKIAGKTGTSQVVSIKVIENLIGKEMKNIDISEIPYHLRDNGWFVAFAPYDNPEIVIVSLVEHGGFGGIASAPLVGKLMKKYFSLKNIVD